MPQSLRSSPLTQKDQTAKGDNGVFDSKTNTITLTGNAVVTQGTNVLTGERVIVDLTTGVMRVESVKAMFNPDAPAPGPAPAAPQKKPTRSAPGAPIRINQNKLLKKAATQALMETIRQ